MGKGRGHVPQRRCIICGAKRAKGELLRLSVGLQGRVVVDSRQRALGRGAYVCAAIECLSGLKRKGVLARAFRKVGLKIEHSLLGSAES